MSGAFNSNHISSCLAKNKLNESKTNDEFLKENHRDLINNIKSPELDISTENEINWKTYDSPNADDNILNSYNSKKKKKLKNKSENNLISGDNCDIIHDKDEKENSSENSVNGDCSVHSEDDDKTLLDSSDKDMKAALTKLGKVAEHLGLTRSNTVESNQVFYYGVHIPYEPNSVVIVNDDGEEEAVHVYTDKMEALKIVKQFKKARFKQFKSEKEALDFALNGDDNSLREPPMYSCATGGEKIISFKCPKTQDMIKFRKAIECGDVEVVRKKIWENPRYLVSNGDTPSILQEGCRYNALHIAAKAKNAEIARLILDSVTNADFISHLYDEEDYESCKSRMDILLDLYLNMPDKALNETPLHIASKLGAVEVVELLTSYPQCQRNLSNKFHQKPKDIICDRVKPESMDVVDAIAAKLEEQYFIPVLRYEDNSMQPKIGKVFSPSEPLRLEEDPLSPRLEIQAFAGPMSKEEASIFQRKWKTPPRTVKSFGSPLALRLCDAEKGLERIGRGLASEFKVPWKEYWSFLDTFVDLSSPEGLELLENYLKRRFEETLEMVNDPNVGNDSNEEGGGEVLSPMSDLCEAFKACSLNEYQSFNSLDSEFKRTRKVIAFRESERKDSISSRKLEESLETDGKHPLLYVERSCEVFGKRTATAMFNVCSTGDLYKLNTDSLRDCLEPEVKHLLSLIKSYRDDLRFQSIDFQLIHSRVASVAVQSLNELLTSDDKKLILSGLKEIDLSDGTLSDDEDLNYGYRNFTNDLIGATTTKQQLHCLVKHLMDKLQDSACNTPILTRSVRTEEDCHILWASAVPCCCSWNNSLIRTRPGAKRKSFKILKQKLDCDILPVGRRVLFEDEREDIAEKSPEQDGDNEDYFSTPPSQSSDSEEENMEDPMEIPDTFIFPGSAPSKTDFAVLDAIGKAPISSDKYPNIYRWRHLVQLHSKPNFNNSGIRDGWHRRRLISFDSPNSSPCKILNTSTSSYDTPNRSGSVEPWQRITGPYTPRRAMRCSSRLFSKEESLSSR